MFIICNKCEYLSISEQQQNFIKSQCGNCPPHICNKYNKRVFHYPYKEPFIYPCKECFEEGLPALRRKNGV